MRPLFLSIGETPAILQGGGEVIRDWILLQIVLSLLCDQPPEQPQGASLQQDEEDNQPEAQAEQGQTTAPPALKANDSAVATAGGCMARAKIMP